MIVYYNATPVRLIESGTDRCLVEWPNGDRAWHDAWRLSLGPKPDAANQRLVRRIRGRQIVTEPWPAT